MAANDNIQAICPFLDRHLVFPLFEFLQTNEIHPRKEILNAKLELLSKTNMVDFAMEIWAEVHGEEPPEEMLKRREEVISNLMAIQEQCGPLLHLVLPPPPPEAQDGAEQPQRQETVAEQLIRDKSFDMPYLSQEYGITQDHLKGFYEFARFQYGCGNYSKAADFLAYFRMLSGNQDKNISALWGKLASEILMHRWEDALSDLKLLQSLIDGRPNVSHITLLQQRTWLLHWSLFIFFNHPNGRTALLELFFSEKYLNTIQTSCPHVLRYLATAVITSKRKHRNALKDLLKIIQQESYTYSDPVTDFIDALFVQFDFDEAQKTLRECEKVLGNDFFLQGCKADFLESARMFIFETYCRIHQCIDISMIAEKLDMTDKDAERWIVNLIRNAHFDAKIDSANNQVILANSSANPYHQLIDKTKSAAYKTNEMATGIQKLSVDS
eukprot:CAMPEP_0201475208 /NCGR_PEP_ID=MMETSP0151_2-20130828/659_1 /ASSEMBLY_ACC=CAM_ASM_000257 /TAXON_ID=200890 /ORGANISM="Paramoeba atlantica, Strain 621/1 / CCAP 1560/9" /LENGTH=439 /DNA_ID=CAMNT_0047855241 /DNA_START=103 /DNA_END=1422 /DNA_ORIENTATION=-